MAETVEVVVGVIGRAHGIRGDVAIDVRTDEPERRFAVGARAARRGRRRTFTVASARDHSGRLLVHFDELADRTAAEAARGTVLVADVDPRRAARGRGRVLRPPAGRARRAGRRRHRGRHGHRRAAPARCRTPSRSAPTTAPGWSPSSPSWCREVDLAAGEVHLADVPGLLTDADDDEPTRSRRGRPTAARDDDA